ncbi:tetratricopeptide repeat protein [Streptomyces bobili]|uniref:tetratricopeptide repeat protein n=1 Tax=Streptomyces bobili TaxID=67280 RepID=UPI0038179FD2
MNGDKRGRAVALPVIAGQRLPMSDLLAAENALLTRRFDDALEAARRSLAFAPELLGAHWIVAEALSGLRRHAEAAEAYQALLAVCPHNPGLVAEVAKALHAAGRASEAVVFQRRISNQSSTVTGAVNEMVMLWSAGLFRESAVIADRLVDKAVDKGSIGAQVRLVRALCRFELGDPVGALEDLDEDLRFLSSATSSGLTGILQRRGRSADDTAARNVRADILAALGRAEEAAAAYEEALQTIDALLCMDPRNAELRGRRAYTLLGLGRPDRALTEAKRAVKRDPTDALAWRSIGRAHLALGNPATAVEALEIARGYLPERVEIRFDLARALVAAGHSTEAGPHLSWAVERSPRLALMPSMAASP